ncbi:MAG: hypothetical protein NTU58_01540 [Candidatus Nealsonbacteria bacterium]|nr:hypothetical protein [Candidatus Nealsonbacteria bacterium]
MDKKIKFNRNAAIIITVICLALLWLEGCITIFGASDSQKDYALKHPDGPFPLTVKTGKIEGKVAEIELHKVSLDPWDGESKGFQVMTLIFVNNESIDSINVYRYAERDVNSFDWYGYFYPLKLTEKRLIVYYEGGSIVRTEVS